MWRRQKIEALLYTSPRPRSYRRCRRARVFGTRTVGTDGKHTSCLKSRVALLVENNPNKTFDLGYVVLPYSAQLNAGSRDSPIEKLFPAPLQGNCLHFQPARRESHSISG